ncbi:MAG: hypothetical protein IPL71_09540 [Anaerolineales bacterium]|uniref:hypothetical protein n=1 Tax=Candidatus Villigracilis proximus TaxID=3140683 RepID=UPI003135D6C8|nr:hypothetical protein [Anaerolineales bacterium]
MDSATSWRFPSCSRINITRFAAAQFGGFFDEEGLDAFEGVQRVQAQTRRREALERFADIGLHREMRIEPLFGQLTLRPILRPELQEFAIVFDLVEEVAAIAFIAHIGDALE